MSLRIPCGARGTLAGVAVECRGIVVRSCTVTYKSEGVTRKLRTTLREYLLASASGRASLMEGSGLWSHLTAVPASELQDAGDHCIWRGVSLRNPASSGSTTELVVVEVEGHVEPDHAVGTTHLLTSFQGSSGSGLMRMQSATGTEYLSGVMLAPEDVAAAFGLPFTPRPRWLSTSFLIIALPVAMLILGSAVGLVWCR